MHHDGRMVSAPEVNNSAMGIASFTDSSPNGC
jgi:hypothetical protein